jgi:hypothetical protein
VREGLCRTVANAPVPQKYHWQREHVSPWWKIRHGELVIVREEIAANLIGVAPRVQRCGGANEVSKRPHPTHQAATRIVRAISTRQSSVWRRNRLPLHN